LLAFPALALSQEAVTVTGIVTDVSSGVPVPGALLTLGETGRQAISDDEGRFNLVRAPAGTYALRVQRYGYRDLERTVTISGGMPPLELRLEPAPIQLDELTVTGNARADLSGIVLDAHSGKPVPWSDVTVTHDAVRQVGRKGASDDGGEFSISDIPAGTYLLRVERIGYHGQYVPVSHGVPPLPVEVRLEADSAMLRGLAVMNGEMDVRRNAHGRRVEVFDEQRLRLAAPTNMRHFLESYTVNPIVECGQPPRRSCIALRGSPTRPVVYIDGVRVFDPPPPPPPPPGSVVGRSNDFPPPDEPVSLDQLVVYSPRELYNVEYFVCQGGLKEPPAAAGYGAIPVVSYVEIHAYTYEYMERMARQPRIPLPSCMP
jgi:hypothetical protein